MIERKRKQRKGREPTPEDVAAADAALRGVHRRLAAIEAMTPQHREEHLRQLFAMQRQLVSGKGKPIPPSEE
jgi:hypothetical protein